MKIHVVSNCCPVGCGSEVILLKPTIEERIFCYCYACGCSWGSPNDVQATNDLEYVKSSYEFSSSSVRWPTQAEIEMQGLDSSVIEVLENSAHFKDILEVVNAEISEKTNAKK